MFNMNDPRVEAVGLKGRTEGQTQEDRHFTNDTRHSTHSY